MAAEYGPAAGLLVFLVGAALLALLGLGTEAGVVETQVLVRPPLGGPRVGERRRPDLSPTDPLPRNGEGERRTHWKGEWGLGADAAAAAAASSSVWSSQISLQRWMRSSGSLNARGLIRFLMWRGNLRRKRTVWASFAVDGCRAVRLSHMTEGLMLLHIG